MVTIKVEYHNFKEKSKEGKINDFIKDKDITYTSK